MMNEELLWRVLGVVGCMILLSCFYLCMTKKKSSTYTSEIPKKSLCTPKIQPKQNLYESILEVKYVPTAPTMCDDTKGHVYPSAIPYTVPLPKQNNDHEHFDKLRDPTVMENVRLYLAYLKDAPPAVSFKGKTNTSVQLFLAGEGIPTYPGTLLRIFVAYHMSLGSTRTCALADLETLSRYVAAKRTKELQEARESHQKFYYS